MDTLSEALLDDLPDALGTIDAEPADDRHMGVTILKPIENSRGDSLLGTNGILLMAIWQRAPTGRSKLFDQMFVVSSYFGR